MKALVMGLFSMDGKSEKGPYSFGRMFVMVPVEQVQNGKMTKIGYGYEPKELDIKPEAVGQFIGLKLPAELDLVTDVQSTFDGFKTVCVGLNRPAPAKVA